MKRFRIAVERTWTDVYIADVVADNVTQATTLASVEAIENAVAEKGQQPEKYVILEIEETK